MRYKSTIGRPIVLHIARQRSSRFCNPMTWPGSSMGGSSACPPVPVESDDGRPPPCPMARPSGSGRPVNGSAQRELLNGRAIGGCSYPLGTRTSKCILLQYIRLETSLPGLADSALRMRVFRSVVACAVVAAATAAPGVAGVPRSALYPAEMHPRTRAAHRRIMAAWRPATPHAPSASSRYLTPTDFGADPTCTTDASPAFAKLMPVGQPRRHLHRLRIRSRSRSTLAGSSRGHRREHV